MTFILVCTQMNLSRQGGMKILRLIVVTASAALFLGGNGLVVKAIAQQAGNSGRTFADWCREKDSLSTDTKHTVEV